MDVLKGLLKPRPTPQQSLREWQRRLRNERLVIDRGIREVQREEKKVEKAIRDQPRCVSVKTLTKELVRSRHGVNHLHENKAQLNSVSMRLGEIIGTERMVGCLSKSAEVMKNISILMKAPALAATMEQFTKEMIKAEVMEEMTSDMIDSALDFEDMEDEIEEEVDKVLAELAAETSSQLPAAARAKGIKQVSVGRAQGERQAVAESADDEEENLKLKEIRSRRANVRS